VEDPGVCSSPTSDQRTAVCQDCARRSFTPSTISPPRASPPPTTARAIRVRRRREVGASVSGSPTVLADGAACSEPQGGGSLAGKDSRLASSTMSQLAGLDGSGGVMPSARCTRRADHAVVVFRTRRAGSRSARRDGAHEAGRFWRSSGVPIHCSILTIRSMPSSTSNSAFGALKSPR